MTNGEYKLVKDVLWYKRGTIFDIQDDKVFEIAPGGTRIETGDALVNAFVKYFDEDGMEEWVSKLPSVSKFHPRKTKTKACKHLWAPYRVSSFVQDNGRRSIAVICQYCLERRDVK